MDNYIKIRGARQHNLKNIDVDIPKNKLVVISGLSGSGKSTLMTEILAKALAQRFYHPIVLGNIVRDPPESGRFSF